jgi:hypothetical protein
LSRASVELVGDGVEVGLVKREWLALREVLAEQSVRVLVRAALPGAVGSQK